MHLRESRTALLAAITDFWKSYEEHVDWENPDALQARVCMLLPAHMLARVDGKSPVEYLSEENQQKVRDLAIPLIADPVSRLSNILEFLLTANLEEN